MQLAQFLVVHVASPLGQPEVHATDNTKDNAGHDHVVKVGNNEVGVVVLEIYRGDTHHQAGETAE